MKNIAKKIMSITAAVLCVITASGCGGSGSGKVVEPDEFYNTLSNSGYIVDVEQDTITGWGDVEAEYVMDAEKNGEDANVVYYKTANEADAEIIYSMLAREFEAKEISGKKGKKIAEKKYERNDGSSYYMRTVQKGNTVICYEMKYPLISECEARVLEVAKKLGY